jgi:hypothetical protein
MITLTSSPRVLLIAPSFFGYEQDIAAGLMSCGQHVDILPDRPFSSPLMKAFLRFRPELGGHMACDYFFARRLEELGQNDYSIILVIQGEGITARTLKTFRTAYPHAKIVFYTWDSIENKPFSKQNLSMYDYCSTFDPVDAKKYGLNFRPLFFADGFDRQTNLTYAYDLSFIGTVHSDRYKIVRALLEQLPTDARTFIYLYLQAPWMFDLRRLFTKTVEGAARDDFCFVPLSKDVVQATFFSSRAVLDIEHVNQHGATMRTIETVGSKRKLVTTNKSLRDYDFYNPLNIQIVDRRAPRLDQDFLQTPYHEVPEEIRQKYTVRQWIQDVCGTEVQSNDTTLKPLEAHRWR